MLCRDSAHRSEDRVGSYGELVIREPFMRALNRALRALPGPPSPSSAPALRALSRLAAVAPIDECRTCSPLCPVRGTAPGREFARSRSRSGRAQDGSEHKLEVTEGHLRDARRRMSDVLDAHFRQRTRRRAWRSIHGSCGATWTLLVEGRYFLDVRLRSPFLAVTAGGNRMAYETLVFKRDEIYGEIWSEPAKEVARRYRISDVALGKICRKLHVPVPGRGYWAKKAAGESLPRIPLPPLPPGTPAVHMITRQAKPQGEPREEVTALAAAEQDPARKIAVPDKLDDPHPQVVAAERLLRKATAKGVADLRKEKRCLDIVVSGSTLDRALRIMDSLLKALEQRGYPVEVTAPTDQRVEHGWSRQENERRARSKTQVCVDGRWLGFGIEEDLLTVKIEPPVRPRLGLWSPGPTYEKKPRGTLSLVLRDVQTTVPTRSRWGDGKSQRVENCLNAFVSTLVLAAERLRLDEEERERRHQEYLAAERRREEAARQREHQAALAYDLTNRTEDWITGQNILAFVKAVEQDAQARLGGVEPGSELAAWLAWAKQRGTVIVREAVQTVLETRQPPRQGGFPGPSWNR